MKAGPIDLRSDTVTRPSPEMRAAMAAAPVGDDQFREDPTTNLLQERIAGLLGKEAAIWLPSGTMANQVAVRTLTRPGDDVIVSYESHVAWHETGGAAANSGVQLTAIGSGGAFTVDEFLAARKPRGHPVYPPTTMVALENTHNRAGGVVISQTHTDAICAAARQHDIYSYLDGARLWNAAIASGRTLSELANGFDLVGVALSKGLGCPGGSLLAGSREIIERATRYRRMFGGAMRQNGIFSAAGIYALDHNLDRLADDHANAKRIASRLGQCPNVIIDLATVQTNIVIFRLGEGAPDEAAFVRLSEERGVLVFAFGPRKIRAVTHLDVTREQCDRAAEVFAEISTGAFAA